ncbi:hypothetical protein [Virgibacillus ihumii]|uniref:hypothetical protein n=1 Tax=Virgibacillus ihumii TaxID=2686091 RepID=UPI00157DE4A9|nr:hypothetical protein [Virgibacillus ihumii]
MSTGQKHINVKNRARLLRSIFLRGKHQPHEANINRTRQTSTARGKHQPHEANINRTRQTSVKSLSMCKSPIQVFNLMMVFM